MGTLESKVKEGYSVKQRPFFKTKLKYGTKPLFAAQHRSLTSSPLKYGFTGPKTENDLLRYSSRTNDTENSDFDFQLQNNCLAYPATAIGLISCVIGGSLKRSTGALISSNVVLTAAHNLFCTEAQLEAGKATFRLHYGLCQWEQYNVEKILIPDEFKNGVQGHMNSKDLSQFDYAVLILSTQVNVDKYGTLGFDFTYAPKENCQNLAIYGYYKKNGGMQIDFGKIKASVGEKMIRYSTNTSIESIGGPIIEIKDQNYNIIGLQNGVYRQEHLYEKKALKLTSEMFDHLGQWITHEEEEIDIRDKELGKEGIKKLVKFKWTSLASINLARNNLGKDGLKYLTRCEWNSLHHLDIGGNDIKKEGVEYLVEINMKNLQSLNMWGNGIEAEGALLLLHGDWKQLNCLNLYNNQLDNEGIRYIIKGNWSELQNLNLGKNKINDAGIRLLLNSTWRNVVSLNLWGNIVKDPKTISSELKKHLNKIKFLYL